MGSPGLASAPGGCAFSRLSRCPPAQGFSVPVASWKCLTSFLWGADNLPMESSVFRALQDGLQIFVHGLTKLLVRGSAGLPG